MLRRLAALITVALLPLMFVSPPAQAVGVGDPVIVSPTGTVANGSPATVRINFSNAPADLYDVTIATPDYSTYLTSQVTYDGVTDLVTVSMRNSPLGTGTYNIEVMSSDYMHSASGTFTVAAPPPPALAFSGVSVSPANFYPLVQDGYRDTTTMRYTLNRSSRVIARVLTTGGTLIRIVDLGTRRGYSWAWNGRIGTGAFAAAGYYNIKITATVTSAPASTKSVILRVRVGPVPALAFSGVSVSLATFYPRVHDGYRDTTTMRYTLNRPSRVIARVLTTGGTLIRIVDLGTRRGYSWAWNGRISTGAFAAAGYYNIKITARVTGAPASTKSVVRRVRLATGYVIKTGTQSRTGNNASSASHTSSCYVNYYYYLQETDLDCWGGSYAKANYGFAVPSSTYSVTWGVTGARGCCSNGTVSKVGSRPTSTYYQVSVKVTNWAAYDIYGVHVTYRYKRRI